MRADLDWLSPEVVSSKASRERETVEARTQGTSLSSTRSTGGGIGWVMLNSVVAVCDRLLQRLLLSKDPFRT